MIRLLPTVLLTVYLGGSLAGCSNGDGSPATTTATASVPATVAPKTRTPFPTATPIPALNLGQSATLENGLRVTLNTIVYNPKLTEGGQNRQPATGGRLHVRPGGHHDRKHRLS